MAVTIKFDLKDSTIKRTTGGTVLTRTALLDGVEASSTGEILSSALNDVSMPSIGDVYPFDDNLHCIDISIERLASQKYRAVILYSDDPSVRVGIENASISVTSTVSESEVAFDKNGDAMLVVHQYPVSGGTTVVRQAFKAAMQVPGINYEYRYLSTTPPVDLLPNVGSINSAVFNSHPAKTVLCTAVDYNSAGSLYAVNIQFVYNREVFEFVGQLRPWKLDTVVTIGPGDVLTGTATFDIYPETDFNSLGLPSLTPPP